MDKAMNDNLRHQIELPAQDKPNNQHAEIDEIVDLGEIDRKIKDCETKLLQANSKRTTGWIMLIGSISIIIPMCIKFIMGKTYWIVIALGLLYLGLNIWRLYSAEKQKKEFECVLRELRDKKDKLQASLIIK